MVGMSAPAGMPHRRYSAVILGGSWPHTDPQSVQATSEAQHGEGIKNLDLSEVVHGASNRVAAEMSGHLADGFVQECGRIAAMYVTHADNWFAMSRVSEEVGRLGYGLRQDLDQIDLEAHQEIARLEEQARLGTGLLALSQIGQVIAKARAKAMAKCATATAAVEKLAPQLTPGAGQGSKLTGGQPGNGGNPTDPKEPGGGPSGTTKIMSAGWDKPPQSPPPGSGPPKRGGAHGEGGAGPDTEPQPPGQGEQPPGGVTGAGNGPGDPKSPRPKFGQGRGGADGFPAPPPMPFSGGSGGGGLPSGGGGLGGGIPGGGGFKLPETPGGLGGGIPGGGGLPQGLTPTNFSPGGAGMTPPSAAPTDFSRGLSAGFGGAPAPIAPPVTQPSAVPASGAPAGAYSPGLAPVAASAGAPAVSSPVAPLSPPGGGGVPAGPVGPLPPFGSDVPRTAVAASAGAAVSPASGAPLAPSASGGSSASAPVAPLPPGVVGSGVGASAGAATEGVRSSRPDPLLESASQLVYQLLHASQKSKYLFMDWCVGVFRTQSGVETVVVNSDGAGYIPAGVFVPRSARMLFADSSLSPAFRAKWFSWANPAETMLAYAELATKNSPGVELWALAVSTSYGGSSVPARAAGVPHFEDCPVDLSPIKETDPPMPLDESHMHRLETVDRALYARLLGFGDGPLPDPSEAWRMTQEAAEAALGRAGAVRDLAVAPVIREILGTLRSGVPVKQERWIALEGAYFESVGMGTSLRPGLVSRDGASPHVRAYFDLARLIEILLLWSLDGETGGRGIKYPEIAYLTRQIVDHANSEGS